jgi:heme exporter protein B
MEWKQVRCLLIKDLKQEWRQKFTLQGILLYAVAAVYIIYISLRFLDKPSWNALFWVIVLFSGVSAVSKSFLQESKGKMLYYHQIVHPASMIVAKIIYSSVLMCFINLLCLLAYTVLLGMAAEHTGLFILAAVLGSLGFSATSTVISAISSKAGNGHLIMPVLSIPLLIPVLLIAVKAGKKAVDGLEPSLIYPDLLALLLFYLLVAALGYMLYPWLWKE